ncbi:MAG: heme NO-binding domain-containing protein [Carboxylicivirga sp.]|jgi:hypothetical protein|nr:heme NO-binding domain-containing protein [Carboxylicivirga sp.]
MKGTVFCEFLNMVEENWGYEMVDRIIIDSNIPHNGAYTSVGTYEFREMVSLLTQLSKNTKISPNKLLFEFGDYLFKVFLKKYPEMFKHVNDGFTFLERVPQKIHIEVNKLYPDAELPQITTSISGNELTMYYTSSRKLGDLAKGLINGCMNHFGEKYTMQEVFVKEDGSELMFKIKRL